MNAAVPLFTLEAVTFRYPARPGPVVSDFSRLFFPGISILRGPSGGGKSTLLKLLAGFLRPVSGRVLTRHGRPPDAAFLRHEIGFVFQQFNLLPSATLHENLVLAGTAAQLSSSKIQESITHWLGRLGLKAVAHAPASHLSGGQLQRAAIARALIKTPDILLLDEPTSGLDDANTALIASLIDSWREAGRSVIISTHDPRLASRFPEADTLGLDDPAPPAALTGETLVAPAA